MAGAFYALMMGVAVGWAWWTERPLFWREAPPSAANLGLSIALGVLFGLGVVALSAYVLERFAWAKDLSAWFDSLLGPISWAQAIRLAALSGVAEEALFRGAIQPSLGLVATSILFALVHMPPTKKLVGWTISAGVLGLIFGVATELSGHIFGPIAAHFTINAINLRAVTRR